MFHIMSQSEWFTTVLRIREFEGYAKCHALYITIVYDYYATTLLHNLS